MAQENSTPEKVDALVIGAGQSGGPLAGKLAGKGWKTVIVEKAHVGGSCVNYGCTPTKTLIASARVAHMTRRSEEYGINRGEINVDYSTVKARKDKVVDAFRSGSETGLRKVKGLELVYGSARLLSPDTVEVDLKEGGTRHFQAGKIIINTGTTPGIPGIKGLEDIDYLTSRSMMNLEEIPGHFLVVGGGYIGLEFGQMFRRFGSKVTIFDHGNRLLKREDEDISKEMANILRKEEIEIQFNTTAKSIKKREDGTLELEVKENGKSQPFTGTHLLIAAGTVPNTQNLGLENAGVETGPRGFIKTNDSLQTSQPNIYALGDVKGGPAFTHVSYDDYRVLRNNLLENENNTISGRLLAYTVFTDPQLGRVGLSENQARKEGYDVKVAETPMAHVARAIETNETNGMMKAVVDRKTGKILGASVLGVEGGEVVSVIQAAIMGGLTYRDLRDAPFSHPTLAESLNNLFMKI